MTDLIKECQDLLDSRREMEIEEASLTSQLRTLREEIQEDISNAGFKSMKELNEAVKESEAALRAVLAKAGVNIQHEQEDPFESA